MTQSRGVRVFVYGTLMRGGFYHHLLETSRFIEEAHTRRAYTLVDLGDYPALLEGGDTSVAGEIFEVTDEVLASLDELEGHPDYYRRDAVVLSDGRRVTSYIFNHEPDGAVRIRSGRWLHERCR